MEARAMMSTMSREADRDVRQSPMIIYVDVERPAVSPEDTTPGWEDLVADTERPLLDDR